MSLHETRFSVESSGLIVIPARLESRRLPRKLLLAETGRTLLDYSIEIARQAVAAAPDVLSGPVVAADADALLAIARDAGVALLLTNSGHLNGTSRIGEVLRRFPLHSSPLVCRESSGRSSRTPIRKFSFGSPRLSFRILPVRWQPPPSLSILSDTACFANPHVVKVACDSDLLACRFFRVLHAQETVATHCYRHLGNLCLPDGFSGEARRGDTLSGRFARRPGATDGARAGRED